VAKPVDLPEFYFGPPRPVRLGFMFAHQFSTDDQGRKKVDYAEVIVPHWSLVALTGVLPAAWCGRRMWRRSAVRRHTKAGCCPRCGYDLRATPGRCPECGGTKKKNQ
jgi:hypothetical protein